MKYRVVRFSGSQLYGVQWCALGVFRGYERAPRRYDSGRLRRVRLFASHSDAQEWINGELEKRRDPGQTWPWQPQSY